MKTFLLFISTATRELNKIRNQEKKEKNLQVNFAKN